VIMAEVSDDPVVLPSVPSIRMSRAVSKNFHRRFPTVRDFVEVLGGSKSFVIEKILIANNGVAAVKAIRSIRQWSYEMFGNEKAISFVVMATPEDLRYEAHRFGTVPLLAAIDLFSHLSLLFISSEPMRSTFAWEM